MSTYSSSKFTVRGLTQAVGRWLHTQPPSDIHNISLAVELAKHDITVNAYSPGIVDTRMSAYHTFAPQSCASLNHVNQELCSGGGELSSNSFRHCSSVTCNVDLSVWDLVNRARNTTMELTMSNPSAALRADWEPEIQKIALRVVNEQADATQIRPYTPLLPSIVGIV